MGAYPTNRKYSQRGRHGLSAQAGGGAGGRGGLPGAGQPLRSQRGVPRAIEDYTRALELAPELAEAWYNRGCAWYEVGELDKATTDLTRAIELSPANGLYYGQRALVHHFNDRPELAEADQATCDELRFGAE